MASKGSPTEANVCLVNPVRLLNSFDSTEFCHTILPSKVRRWTELLFEYGVLGSQILNDLLLAIDLVG
jgi:hypothetical protein